MIVKNLNLIYVECVCLRFKLCSGDCAKFVWFMKNCRRIKEI